jgi:hypothetical protein
MSEGTPQLPLTWVDSQSPLPPLSAAWGQDSDAPGLLAAGADLGVERLLEAYQPRHFSVVQPRSARVVVEPRSPHGS